MNSQPACCQCGGGSDIAEPREKFLWGGGLEWDREESIRLLCWSNKSCICCINISICVWVWVCTRAPAQSCPTLCNPIDCSPSGSSVHRIFQARILKCFAISDSRGSSKLRDQTWVSLSPALAGGFLTTSTTWEAHCLQKAWPVGGGLEWEIDWEFGIDICTLLYLKQVINQDLDSRGKSASVPFSCSVVSNSLWPYGLQHTRLPCPSPTPRAYSNSCPSRWWYHLTISSSVVPFSSHLQSFPASGSFLWVDSLHQVAKVLEFQLQHQSFQWIFRIDFL